MIITTIIIYSFESFSHQGKLMVSHWCLSDSKSPQVFRSLLSILVDLNDAVVWMVFIISFKSSGNFNNPLGIVPKTKNRLCNTITFMFLGF